MALPQTFTLPLAPLEAPRLKLFFLDKGFEIRDAPYAFWQARGPGCNATFYTSGKLLLQGPEADVYRALLGDDTPETRPYHRALGKHPQPLPAEWIGTDEAGKGDYFGPLVVAGVSLPRKAIEILAELGIDDSKKLSDDRMSTMVEAVRSLGPWEELVIMPARYNEMYGRARNLNLMLAWAHAKVIENLLEKGAATWVLIDKFAEERVVRGYLGEKGKAVALTLRTKAEEDPAVAAASVLARSAYMRCLRALSKRYDVELRPGAGAPTLAVGRELVRRHGPEVLAETGKLHFVTTQQITGG
ncbi:MAG: ribonuclease HIII [Myxococcales bacterium]|nr:ribonuclease HIII [Myxococcales bacterium]